MVPLAEYERMRVRPDGKAVMTQRWRSLSFLHFAADPNAIQKLLPKGLSVDTFTDEQGIERAWIGVAPFRMEGVTLSRWPEIPGIHAFPETNVRTYEHRDGTEPGVWFFSLDAANGLACKFARCFFHLPYHESEMVVHEAEDRGRITKVTYVSERRSGGQNFSAVVSPAELLPNPLPGSFEFFLVERYLLYSWSGSKLNSGRVFHPPYTIRRAQLKAVNETLVSASRIEPKPFSNVLFSDGVDVEVFPLRASSSARVTPEAVGYPWSSSGGS